MGREIKFRAWARDGEWDDDGEKRMWVMIPADSLSFEKFAPTCDLLKNAEDEIYFMQFTGLKDKNGKEIYEGDIVKRSSLFYPKEVKFKTSKYFNGWNIHEGHYGVNGIEVIGNIYENPKLINK